MTRLRDTSGEAMREALDAMDEMRHGAAVTLAGRDVVNLRRTLYVVAALLREIEAGIARKAACAGDVTAAIAAIKPVLMRLDGYAHDAPAVLPVRLAMQTRECLMRVGSALNSAWRLARPPLSSVIANRMAEIATLQRTLFPEETP